MMNDLPTLAIGFATCAHRNQRRKYTGEPYVNHCRNVASLVALYNPAPYVVAAAALHDVLEDTDVTEGGMREVFGDAVTALVLEVTDVSRREDGNRHFRKHLDREHLAKSSPGGATIKLADLIDNATSIVEHDPKFARVYLREKEALLEVLKHGHPELWQRANSMLGAAKFKLAIATGVQP